MKKRNYFLTMVLAALAGISICSCNDDDDNGGNGGDNASNSFIMKFTGLVTDSLSYAEDSTLKAAYVNAFEVSDFRSSFSIKGKDSIEISEKIMEKCSLAEASLEGRDFINAHTISIYKTNNDDEGEKKSTYYVWYNKEYYSSTDQFFSYNNAKPFYNAGGYNYATEIKIQQEYFNDNGDKARLQYATCRFRAATTHSHMAARMHWDTDRLKLPIWENNGNVASAISICALILHLS